MNKRRGLLIAWVLITLALAGLAVMPAVWAMPSPQENWTVPTRTPTPGPSTPQPPTPQPPTSQPPTSQPPTTQPPTPQPPAQPTDTPLPPAPTATPVSEDHTPPPPPSPSATQTAGATPSMEEQPATGAMSTATPDSGVASALTPTGAATSVGEISPTTTMVPADTPLATSTPESKPASTLPPIEASMPERGTQGSGAWLFFGGVGLLLLGVVLLLTWRRRG